MTHSPILITLCQLFAYTFTYSTESRDIIKNAVNATEQDEIIFCNNPSARLAQLFGGNLNGDENRHNKVVLFVSNLEPEYNIKAWVDAGAHIEKIEKNRDGFLDLVDLERKLCQHKDSGSRLVTLFSTVSRLTGILSDDVATTILLHQHGAICIWDYTASCSCSQINVNPELPLASKDAIFFSCSNMIGGVQAGGILVVKKALLQNSASIQMEMISSTNIVRCGLVMQLKETLGSHIMTRNEKICKQVLSHIRTIPEILLLGSSTTVAKRIPTICIMIKHPRGTYLHHRFVVAILNDVFGIQSTASNLIHQTLGINDTLKAEYERFIKLEGDEGVCPGYTQITFPFFMTDSEIGFILEALKMVAQEGWKLLPQYEITSKSGEWRHLTNALAKERKWLHSIRYNDGRMLFNDRRISAPDRLPQNYGDCLQTARNIFSRSRKTAQRSNSDDTIFSEATSSELREKLRWYVLPREAHELLSIGPSQNVKNEAPFDPKKIVERSLSLSLEIRRFQKSRSLIDSLQPPKKSPPPPPEKQHSVEFSAPASPIVRFTLGGDTKCAMTNFTNIHMPNRNR
jgi:selenocysteine lyase/cysteine desulfurase